MCAVVLSALVVVGCAVTPPPPPLTDPIGGASTEYRRIPFRWKDDTRLAYTTSVVIEAGGKSESSVTTMVSSTTGRTAAGLYQVLVVTNGEEDSHLFFDDEGRLKDAVSLRKKTEGTAWDPEAMLKGDTLFSAALVGRVVRVGERLQIEVDPSEMMPGIAGRFLHHPIIVTYEFIGYHRLNARRVAVVRVTVPNVIRVPFHDGATRVDTMAMEGTGYIEADQGFGVAMYAVLTAGGEVQSGKRLVIRGTMLMTLDEANSRVAP
jgi:hypothetical protein